MSKFKFHFKLGLLLPVLLVLGLLFGFGGVLRDAPAYLESFSTKATYPDSYEFKSYDRVLKKYVKYGLVDYKAARNSRELKEAYEDLKHTSPDKLKGKLEQLSFWINAYNLLTIKCIADHYPVDQLRQEAATCKFIVGGKLYSLDQIKDEVFPQLISSSDWRAIFLICNGSVSAPFIANYAYSPSILADELPKAARRFVLSPANYSINEKEKTFSVSPFYKWNLRYIDDVYPSPFDMVNSFLPRERQLNLDAVYRNYAMPFDYRINDIAWLKTIGKGDLSAALKGAGGEKK